MTRNLLAGIRLICIAIVLVNCSTALAQDHAAKVQEVLALAHKYRQFNGTALVAENGKVIYKGAFGMANMEWNIPNTADTKFRLGSITKQFTATVILQAQSKALMYKPFLDNYAYGWVVRNVSFKVNDQPVQVIAHGGGINGFTTVINRYPKEKNLIVILDNTATSYLNRISETIEKIIYNQPYEPPKMSIVPTLAETITKKGIEAGIAQYRDLKAKESATYNFAEPELNRLGYQLLRSGKVKEAIEVFKLNVEAYPKGANTYDSLAEAYMINNDRDLAIQNYKKSLELNPNNTNATEMLKKLEKRP
jgi:Beta-lactamase/Tetratricopeptide repeat